MKTVPGVALYTFFTFVILSNAEEDTEGGKLNKIIGSSRKLYNDTIEGVKPHQTFQDSSFKTNFIRKIHLEVSANTQEDVNDVSEYGRADNRPACAVGQEYKIRFPGNCKQYYKCENGTLTVEKCSFYQNFDVITHTCRFSFYVDCNLTDLTTTTASGTSRTTPSIPTMTPISSTVSSNTTVTPNSTSPTTTTNTKPATTLKTTTPVTLTTTLPSSSTSSGNPLCSSGQYYKIRYPDDCSKYYYCNNGTLSILKCPFLQNFDAISQECNYVIFVDCSVESNTTSSPETSTSHSVPSSSSAPTTTISTISTTQRTDDPSTAHPVCTVGNNYKKRYPNDCQKYYQCLNGKLTVEKCSYLHNFDVISESCRIFYNVDCSIMEGTTVPTSTTQAIPTTQKPVSCNLHEQFNYPDFTNCRRYYECNFGKVTLKECVAPLLFDGPTKKCVIFYIATCQTSEVFSKGVSISKMIEISSLSKSDYESDKRVDLSYISTSHKRNLFEVKDIKEPSCSPGQFYQESFPENCNMYYECNNGVLDVKSCGYFYNFDVISKSCKLIFLATCDVSGETTVLPNTTPTTTTTTTTTPIPTTTSVISTTTDVQLTCKKGKSFKLKYPGTCNKYYNCNDGELTVEKCIIFFYFDDEYEKCRFYWFVECDSAAPTTVTPFTTTITTTQKPINCGLNEIVNYPDPRNCKQYFRCEYGKLYNMTCANLLLFDNPTRKCMLFYLATCAQAGEDVLYLESSESREFTSGEEALINYEGRAGEGTSYEKRDTLENSPPQLSSEQTIESRRAAIIESILRPISFQTLQKADTEVPTCKKGQSFLSRYPYDCQKYYKCEDSKLTIETCSYLKRFDYGIKECRFYWYVDCETIEPPVTTELPDTTTHLSITTTMNPITTNPTTPTPSCHPGQFYKRRHPKFCNKFYECKNGTITLETCSYFQNFDSISQTCTYAWLVDCNVFEPTTEFVPTETTTTVPPTTAEPICAIGQFYKQRHPQFCNKYYQCNNGSITLESCFYLRNFDSKIKECRFYWLVDCNKPDPTTSPTITTMRTTNTPSLTTRAPSSTTTPSGLPICEVGMNFKSRYPNDCKKYYNCENGTLTIQSCSYFMSFDTITQTCKLSVFADCDDSKRKVFQF